VKSLKKVERQAIKVDKLTFGYLKTQTCFSSATFSLKEGEKAVLLSGLHMGKSTLMRILAGLEDNYIGKIELLGYSMGKTKLAYKNVVYLPEKPVLLENKSVEANIDYALKVLHEKSDNLDYILKVPHSLEGIQKLKARRLSVINRTLLEIERAGLKNIKLLLIDRSIDDIKAEIKNRKEDENKLIPELKNMYGELIKNSSSAIISCESIDDIKFYSAEDFTVFYVYMGKILRFNNLEEFEQNIIEADALKYLQNYNVKLMRLVCENSKFYLYETVARSKKEFEKIVYDNIKKRKIIEKNNKKQLQNVKNNKNNVKIDNLYVRKINLQKYPKILNAIVENDLESEEYFLLASLKNGNKKTTLDINSTLLFVSSTGERVL